MPEHRKNPRYPTEARASITGFMEGENLLKDLSISGCCVECHTVMEIKPGIQYGMEIEPERSSHIGNFQLQVEQKWIRVADNLTEIGFLILASPKGKQFQHYIDYLVYRSNNI